MCYSLARSDRSRTTGDAHLPEAAPFDGPDQHHDHPLRFCWHPLQPAAFDVLGLPAPRSRAEAATRASILTEAYLIARLDPLAWLSYSRNRNFYAAPRRYRRTAYTYSTVVGTIDLLEHAGVIEHDRAPPGRRGRQSTFRASSELMASLGDQAMAVVYDPQETIILRDRDGNPLGYRDTDQTRGMRKRLGTINEALSSAKVSHPALGVVKSGDPIRFGKANGCPACLALHRVFTGNFHGHGRFYGGWWQNIPKAERSCILVNGEATYEADYPRLHISLAYLLAGKPLQGDPYDISPWPAPLVKIAVNVMLNARDRLSASRAVASRSEGKVRSLLQRTFSRPWNVATPPWRNASTQTQG